MAAVCSPWGKRACWEELWLGGKLPIDLRFSVPPPLFDNTRTIQTARLRIPTRDGPRKRSPRRIAS